MFVVCGEALMDVFATGEIAGGTALNAVMGGSSLNVAVGLARLGQPVSFLGSVSVDSLGRRLMRALKDEGVATETVVQTTATTTLGLVGLDSTGVPSYTFYGTSDRQLKPDALRHLPEIVSAFHFGSYSLVAEPAASTLRILVEAEHRRCFISYDPNIRLNIEPSLQCWHDVLQWMVPRTHLLKVSDEDLRLLFPGMEMASVAAAWLSQGVRLLVITRGAEPAIAWTSHCRIDVPCEPTKVVDTVGAGDSFQAALLTWLAEHRLLSPIALGELTAAQMHDAVGFAMQAAAVTCGRQGADMPGRDELSPPMSGVQL